jgi:hypothetical protein
MTTGILAAAPLGMARRACTSERVADEIASVGDPALEGLNLDCAGPKRQRPNAVGVNVVRAIHFVGSFHAKADRNVGNYL